MNSNKIQVILIMLVVVIVTSIAQISMKTGMSSIEVGNLSSILSLETIVSILTNFYVILGLTIYFGALILLFAAMSKEDVSFTYPLLSIGYITTAIFAVIFLDEKVETLRSLGIGLIFFGSVFIGKS